MTYGTREPTGPAAGEVGSWPHSQQLPTTWKYLEKTGMEEKKINIEPNVCATEWYRHLKELDGGL